MSYDRVLPKPALLHYEAPQVTLPRPTSNLLEHKIMNDDVSQSSIMARRQTDSEFPQVHLSSLNQAKMAFNKIVSSAPVEPSKPATAPLMTELPIRERPPIRKRSSQSERSSSSGPATPDTLTESKTPATQFCLCQPDRKIPRPRNAFILYRQHHQAAVVQQNPRMPNPEISKVIGVQWRGLPQEVKDQWKELSKEEKLRHDQKYPGYRYQPRRSGRDGNSRRSGSGISHNPPGSEFCNRCNGRIIKLPMSPRTPSSSSTMASHPETIAASSIQCRGKDQNRAPKPIKVEPRPNGQRQWNEHGSEAQSPGFKRRRFNSQSSIKSEFRDKSPESLHPVSPYVRRSNGPISFYQRPFRPVHDPSLKLPPLQTPAAVSSTMTPVTPFSVTGSSLEATVMTIPFINKIKVLAKISPPLMPSFREGNSQHRGAVIAVDGQDATSVKNTVDYLSRALEKEGRYNVRVFEGPEIHSQRGASASGQMGDATVDYLNTISAWHRISDEIVKFVKPNVECPGMDSPEMEPIEDDASSGVSPRSILPRTANLRIHTPSQSSDSDSESSFSPDGISQYSVPIALVPRYQLSTADSFACSVPIGDSYAPLDHWQWMASLWRACVGPDITVCIQDCEKDELERIGGNPVELRLQDARAIVVRKAINVAKELEEKTLKRVGFEIEDYLTQ